MEHGSKAHIREVRWDQGADLCRALGHHSRFAILGLLSKGDLNINEIGTTLGLSQPTVTRHIQQLEAVGLVVSEYMPGQQGMQKRCRLGCDRLIVSFEEPVEEEFKVEEVSMPIGLYTLAHPQGTCGLANRTKIIGFLDKPLSFFDPERATAQIIWMAGGFVEYTFPNDLPASMEVTRVELLMEVGSEAPDHDPDWPSDVTVWMNGVEIGTWTCPGDFGGQRVPRNPIWWNEHMSQHGLLKIWSVDAHGTYVDGSLVSPVGLERLTLVPQAAINVRIGVKADAEHQGGFNLFGSGFGKYAQDLVLRLHYANRDPAKRRPEPAHAFEIEAE